MTCHHLRLYAPSPAWSVATCAARRRLYVPSVAELDSYCRNARHDACPYFERPDEPASRQSTVTGDFICGALD